MTLKLSSYLIRLACAALLCMASATALHAQTENGCLPERAALASANEKVADAQREVDNAWAICTQLPNLCGDRLDSAFAKLFDAQMAQTNAQMALDSCLNSQPPSSPPGGGGGGGGGGTPTPTCYWIDWYISFDDGVTWEYLGSEYYCP